MKYFVTVYCKNEPVGFNDHFPQPHKPQLKNITL